MISCRDLPVGKNIYHSVADSDIIECNWGKWSGDTIPLSIKVLKGITSITVTADDIEEELVIYVCVLTASGRKWISDAKKYMKCVRCNGRNRNE